MTEKWGEIRNDYIEEDGTFCVLHIDAYPPLNPMENDNNDNEDGKAGTTIAKLIGIVVNNDVKIYECINDWDLFEEPSAIEALTEGYTILKEFLKE